jgi:hypothetical protein
LELVSLHFIKDISTLRHAKYGPNIDGTRLTTNAFRFVVTVCAFVSWLIKAAIRPVYSRPWNDDRFIGKQQVVPNNAISPTTTQQPRSEMEFVLRFNE